MDTVNLIPPDYLEASDRSVRIKWWSVILGATVLLIGAASLLVNVQYKNLERTMAQMRPKYTKAATQSKQLKKLQAEEAQLRATMNAIHGQLVQYDTEKILSAIAQATRPDVWLVEVSIKPLNRKRAGKGAALRARGQSPQRTQLSQARSQPGPQLGKGSSRANASRAKQATPQSAEKVVIIKGHTLSNDVLASFISNLALTSAFEEIALKVSQRRKYRSYSSTYFEVELPLPDRLRTTLRLPASATPSTGGESAMNSAAARGQRQATFRAPSVSRTRGAPAGARASLGGPRL